ncbi:hypothetical protein HOK68_00915 [Candidatus Woesearchaeota archaeon]|jgi:hypothetical protein|nr:hypothetical protein [Candidatus Woesearchaeota archaeon]MBT4388055.1 hypothetical protein [Candidatus Woesearchaeota archaeon]MBT4596320.1 hypothetical protein [Candidatus Woesearchaeota archaeon]MBT5740822.1 hypothetical protein [Candidatus Woesearchaeota archaeon]MBT6505322.1 hypothetical protein [Candidatus Woesearchaeota archaeon]
MELEKAVENSHFKRINVSPLVWPGKNLKLQPGDLSQFVPYGESLYGYQENNYKPIIDDPRREPSGGIIYFDNSVSKEDFEGFLRMTNVKYNSKDYAAFIQESYNPVAERYFTQMRLVSKFGLKHLFGALDQNEYDTFKDQDFSIGDALWEFMNVEKNKYGTFFGNPNIDGKMGGDGDWAREQLSFGFMLENEYNSIYRIWSKAWLVTK